jgi:pyruvate formate lyase activating enzyme
MNCPVCFRHCLLEEGQLGFCKARKNENGKSVPANYGLITSLALDPIEKKPLRRFYPGSYILSVGSYGCNLSCPFCQNYAISQADLTSEATRVSPDDIVSKALALKRDGENIGIAFTYNEPLVGYEFVRDTAALAKTKDLKTVLVTNGCFSLSVLAEVLPFIDAMNIDLKGYTNTFFSYIGGSLPMTKAFIGGSYSKCHVELTTLVVPHHNDDLKAFEEECQWIASLSPEIPLHLSRYFPRYHETEPMTPLATLKNCEAIARRYLKYVYLGNI